MISSSSAGFYGCEKPGGLLVDCVDRPPGFAAFMAANGADD